MFFVYDLPLYFIDREYSYINEIIEIGSIKVKKSPTSSKNIITYNFKVGDDYYSVKFGNHGKNIYEMDFFLDFGEREFHDLTKKFKPAKVYSGVLESFRMFVEENQPYKITMTINWYKKTNQFKKIIKIMLNKYKDIFNGYKILSTKEISLDDNVKQSIITVGRKE